MKILFKILLLVFILITATSCRAQLVQTVMDAKKLEINKDKFIGKPLSSLLKQIKPQIKSVLVIPGSSERLSTICFYFLPHSDIHKFKEETGKNPVEIWIRLKEYDFKWDPSTRPQDQRYDWTKEDEETFGKMTLVQIKVNNAD